MRVFVFFILLHVSLFGGSLHFFHNYEKAIHIAQQKHKPLYIFISSQGCRWCYKFETTTLKNGEVQKLLQEDFVLVHLVRHQDSIPKRFQSVPVPRHYFVNDDGRLLYDALGYRKVSTFKAFLGYALDQI